MNSQLEKLRASSSLFGSNAPFVESLYEDWLADNNSVAAQWQQFFSSLQTAGENSVDRNHSEVIEHFRSMAQLPAAAADSSILDHKQAGVLKLINAYRVRGHQKANLDPLGLSHRPDFTDLDLSTHDLNNEDLESEFDTGSLAAETRLKLGEIIAICERSYCGHLGTEYMHITSTKQRRWLQQRLEGSSSHSPSVEIKKRILQKLTGAEGLEKYLHTRFTGQKRFSLEGSDTLISFLNETIFHNAELGVRELVLGMAHRGRLNVLVNIMGKPSADLFAEFAGELPDHAELTAGDVKYHLGYSSDIDVNGKKVHLALAFNPSHLEIVNPVVAGSTRARQTRRNDDNREQVLPIIIHGDAAFAGQGVVMELFNMSQARGFAVGGSLHIIVNNQIGFTTSNPLDTRSTLYCTEVAKLVQAPIFHVNADDPEAVHFAMQAASDFRLQFKKDVVVDLVSYRRHGHNEADEPSATQPMMYKVIKKMKTVRHKYAEQLANEGVVTREQSQQSVRDFRDALDRGDPVARPRHHQGNPEFIVDWQPHLNRDWDETVDTSLPVAEIQRLSNKLTTLPKKFKLHARVQKIMDDRVRMANEEIMLDWGFAETLAYARLVENDFSLRLVGQDSGRGTFFHRHAVLHNQLQVESYTPLANLSSRSAEKNRVTIIDSLLSEEAVMGFEYGYATSDPDTLVIWEGQFGDFANGAQVVIDQFITSGEAKWGRLCGLVLFLPHGYEGQGPEHSSARLERFMQMCSHNNIQVCIPSTPAQMFHLISRQMMRPYRKPLIVMTPKSMLRNKASSSPMWALSEGGFQLVIDDRDFTDKESSKPKFKQGVKRVVLCSGKVYYDLHEKRENADIEDIALVRIEQLYPFPQAKVVEILSRYPKAKEIIWCQEEPENQGAWYQIRHHLEACISTQHRLSYIGRQSSPSPAVGYFSVHLQEQQLLVNQALDIESS
ncbi:MAG: 2-oxoglutarate dehydrogenase E1 component [Xanthomonadales bacterium]|nr:2-oxoglutarate dehydrogenase E1 component [Xanthomonadales bacterium]